MAWLSGQSYNTSCCVLYVLKTRYLILRETIKKSIPVIEPWCDKCMYNLFSSTLIQVFPYSANISDMKWGFRVIVESNITPKFRACDEGVICESPIVINGRETFDNCWRDPNRRNSVFSSFNFKKFCLIQLRISWIHFSSVVIHESAGSWALSSLHTFFVVAFCGIQ